MPRDDQIDESHMHFMSDDDDDDLGHGDVEPLRTELRRHSRRVATARLPHNSEGPDASYTRAESVPSRGGGT